MNDMDERNTLSEGALRTALQLDPDERTARFDAAALVAAAVFDWSRPADQQVSVWLYDRAVIQFYQQHIRSHTGTFIRCRFRPSCSQYSFEAMRTHGFAKGIALSLWRLCRNHFQRLRPSRALAASCMQVRIEKPSAAILKSITPTAHHGWVNGSGCWSLCTPSYTEKTLPTVNNSSATRNDQK